tara:strand:- start:10364 stop:10840 length:477 start_codon:yes stop_codon:yes gene_type:complete
MRINFDRLSQLAGLPASEKKEGLNEGMSPMDVVAEDETGVEEEKDEAAVMDEMDDKSEMDHMEEDLDEMIEIDEVMLVQELRRVKKIMQEQTRNNLNESRQRQIFEKELKQVIDEEVQNVMQEMNITADWMYGDNKPTRSKAGYTNQGSMLPGYGFRR